MAELEGVLERKVHRMLSKGAEPEEVAAMLVKKGWEPGEAEETAFAEDRHFQDRQREHNMGKTHAPRSATRTGGLALGGLAAIYVGFKLLRLLMRLLAE